MQQNRTSSAVLRPSFIRKAGLWAVGPIVAMAGMASSARGAVVAYTEPPDLNTSLAAPSVLPAFDFGVNTVSGRVDPALSDPSDYFQISLPAGGIITGLTATMSDVSSAATLYSYTLAWAPAPAATYASGLSSNTPTAFNVLQLSPTVANMTVFGFVGGPIVLDGSAGAAITAASYTYTFTVSAAVPEPTSVGLLALAATTLLRRKRR